MLAGLSSTRPYPRDDPRGRREPPEARWSGFPTLTSPDSTTASKQLSRPNFLTVPVRVLTGASEKDALRYLGHKWQANFNRSSSSRSQAKKSARRAGRSVSGNPRASAVSSQCSSSSRPKKASRQSAAARDGLPQRASS